MTDAAIAIAAAVLDGAVKTSILAAAAQLLTRRARVSDPGRVHALFLVVLAASLLLPAIALLVPASVTSVGVISAIRVPKTGLPLLAVIGAGTYVVGVVVEVVRLATGLVLARRILRESRTLRPDEAAAIGAHIDPVVWSTVRPLLRMHPSIRGPVTFGSWQPVIVLPPDCASWSADQLLAIFIHEHAHIARWDYLVNVAIAAHRMVYWFNPVSWWIARRLALLAEFAADRTASSVFGEAGYAQHLVNVGALLRDGPTLRFGLTVGAETRLAERIDALLTEQPPRRLSGTRFALLSCLALGLCVTAPARSRAVTTTLADHQTVHQQLHGAGHGHTSGVTQPH